MTAALTLAAAASAGSPAIKIDLRDESFTDVNPCTGATVTVTYHYTTFVIREGPDGAGGFHVTGTGTGIATTSDGFSGRFTFWFGGNERPDGSFNETFTNSNTLGDGSGARILVSVQSHVTMANGELRVEHEQVKAAIGAATVPSRVRTLGGMTVRAPETKAPAAVPVSPLDDVLRRVNAIRTAHAADPLYELPAACTAWEGGGCVLERAFEDLGVVVVDYRRAYGRGIDFEHGLGDFVRAFDSGSFPGLIEHH